MPSALPGDFFTVASMATLAGATGVTFVICNGIQKAFNFNPSWFGLLVAIIVVELGVIASGSMHSWIDFAIGVVNGFLVFCSAAGATAAAGNGNGAHDLARDSSDAVYPQTGNRRRFLQSWF